MKNYNLVHTSGAKKNDLYMVNGRRVNKTRFKYLQDIAKLFGVIDCLHTVNRQGRISTYTAFRV